jgi:ribosome-binding protein aMBF1 (putative translation factor)
MKSIDEKLKSNRAVQSVFEAARKVAPPRAERPQAARASARPGEAAKTVEAPQQPAQPQETASHDDQGRAAESSDSPQHLENLQAEADIDAAVSPAVRDTILRARSQAARNAAQVASPVTSWAESLMQEIERGEVWPDDKPAEEWPAEVAEVEAAAEDAADEG